MTPRRLFVGSLVLLVVCCWCWSRSSSQNAHARPVDPTLVSATDDSCDSNEEEQEHRYRNSQCRHWRQMMVGTR